MVEPPTVTVFSGAEFLARLTLAEYAAIINAAAPPLTAANTQLAQWLDMFRLAGEINVASATAQAAKAALVNFELLTAERAAEVFATA